MKKLTFLIIFCNLFNTFSQSTYVPDDNFEQFLINKGYDSGALDNYVPTQNINSLTELHIFDNDGIAWEIESLQGIEDFISLEKLTLDINEVVSINLSSNTKLKELIINSGSLLENLNITNNLELEKFHCIVTSLPNINLSNNKKIKDLVIGNSSIIDLDLSKNTQLEKVNVGHGIIQNINLKNGKNTIIADFYAVNQPELQCIRVDNTTYSKTNWTQIDNISVFSETCGGFQQLTYVPDDNFEQELINLGYDSGSLDDYVPTNNINTITELNLNFKNISDLTGIQDFIALEDLNFTHNQITEVNLTTLLNLKNLYSNNNILSELDITQNTKLVNLFTGSNSISQINLSNNPLLEQLSVRNNNLSEINIDNLTNLNWLAFDDNNISTINLNNNLEIKYLYCNNNNLSGSLDLSDKVFLLDISCGNNPLTEIKLPPNNKLDGVHVNSTLISELDLRNQSNLISHPASFLEIQDNINLTCVFVDNVNRFNTDTWGAITKDSQITFVANEAECLALNCTIVVDEIEDQEVCGNYTLSALTNGNYYTQSGGKGIQLKAGDIITSTQTIFIYNTDSSNSTCFKESSFEIIIHQVPNIDTLSNQEHCDNYILPVITNGSYYTQSSGKGKQLKAGDIITSTQKIYIYNQNINFSSCINESSFTVKINNSPVVDVFSNISIDKQYVLPTLTNGSYYTQSNGNGTQLNAGDIITTTQKIYVFSKNNKCSNESDFEITIIKVTPEITIPNFFTPNNDGKNDKWIVKPKNEISDIYIFNRYGKIIGKPSIELGWDGNYNSKKMLSDTYWYKIILKNNRIIKGKFALIY